MKRRRHKGVENYEKITEFVLINEMKIREAVKESRLQSPPVPEIRDPYKISNPTANIAISNMTPLKSVIVSKVEIYAPEAWLEVLNKAYEWLKGRGGKYYEGLKKFYTEDIHYGKICIEYEISVDKFYKLVKDFKVRVMLNAAYRHLIKID